MYEKKQRVAVSFLLMYVTFFIYTLSSVCAKLISFQDSIAKKGFFLFLEFFTLGIYAILWQQILKRLPLSLAMPNKAVTVVYGMVIGMIFFKESLTVNNVIGIIFLVIGMVMVSKDV